MKLCSSRVSESTASCIGAMRAFPAESEASIFESAVFAQASSSARSFSRSCSSCCAPSRRALPSCATLSSSLARRAPSPPWILTRTPWASSLARCTSELLSASSFACSALTSLLRRLSTSANIADTDFPALSAPWRRLPKASASEARRAESSAWSFSSPAACVECSRSTRSESPLLDAVISARRPSKSRTTRSAKLRRSTSACLNASSNLARELSSFIVSCSFWSQSSTGGSRSSCALTRSSSKLCPHDSLLSAFSSASVLASERCSSRATRSTSALTSSVIRCPSSARSSSSRAAC
mmetsp:Transcript_21934/g.65894  ORF Transcript_21934/g.65894 Transcript_21934/m.65894 type:complete len:297 (+) Transcript_21934:839-1729(+)